MHKNMEVQNGFEIIKHMFGEHIELANDFFYMFEGKQTQTGESSFI